MPPSRSGSSPTTRSTPRWRRSPSAGSGRPLAFTGLLLVLFAVGEAAGFAGVPYIPQLNWVIGWLGFQVAGFAWQAHLLPTGRRLVALAAGFWALALAAVTLGPWPAVMLHHGGIDHSPTHPPSTALLLFGFAYSFTAAALAPAITRWLERSATAWRLTIAANAVAMSVYLWHMTAGMLVIGVAYFAGLLPHADPGTAAWWTVKVPFLLANVAVLVPIVKRVAPIEQRQLLRGPTCWRWGTASMLVVAALLSASIKAWSSPHAATLVPGLIATLAIWHLILRERSGRPLVRTPSTN
ncbi:hypothetical protein ACE2AJ_02545 [Aquihabitans daechungensis]|uniref:hypothetical protein n=1 Tax=Aquihabitans daechungensis TaxID=1052257 RepID=UPI003B9E4526